MKTLTILSLALGAMLLTPTGAFAKDKNKHHKHHHDDRRDWSRHQGDDRDYRDYRDTQRDIERDRLQNGYNRDGSPRYQYYRYRGR